MNNTADLLDKHDLFVGHLLQFLCLVVQFLLLQPLLFLRLLELLHRLAILLVHVFNAHVEI